MRIVVLTDELKLDVVKFLIQSFLPEWIKQSSFRDTEDPINKD